MPSDDDISISNQEIDFNIGHEKSVAELIYAWLLKASYWLGYLEGTQGDGDPLWCDKLQYTWDIYNGVRIYIQARGFSSRYSRYDLGMFSAYGQHPFEFRLPKHILVRETYAEIEQLIAKFFPGIHRANTWAICEIQESDDCWGKRSAISICVDIDNKKACSDCKEFREKQRTKEFYGYIYLIGNKEKEIYKIGVSRQPKNRYKAFRTKLPFPVEILHTIGTDNMVKAEKLLHGWFEDKRSHGEWFELDTADVDLICGIESFEQGVFKNPLGKEISQRTGSD